MRSLFGKRSLFGGGMPFWGEKHFLFMIFSPNYFNVNVGYIFIIYYIYFGPLLIKLSKYCCQSFLV